MTKRPPPKLHPPLRDLVIFLGLYASIFVIVRFDIRFFFGLSGRHPHSVGTSAWVALIGTIIGALYLRTKENR
jgi:membrane associated rhomboid family serine protease